MNLLGGLMIHKQLEWSTSDGLQVFGQVWLTEQPPRAGVVIVHGLGEHCGRYEHVAQFFAENGLHTFGFDQRGFGKTGGKRGHTPSFQQLMEEISLAIQHAKQVLGEDLPLFLYGHSMGGLEVLYYGLFSENTLAGIIATAPTLDVSNFSKVKIALAKQGSSLFPKMAIATGLNTEMLSRDPHVVESYRNDPLVHGLTSFRLAESSLKAMQRVLENPTSWQQPLLLMHGIEDHITSINGTDTFYQSASGDITYIRWEDLFHEIHNEPEKEQVLQKMVDWILSRV
jgi:alpha-beta hydrolase superfamily lysophospholipase